MALKTLENFNTYPIIRQLLFTLSSLQEKENTYNVQHNFDDMEGRSHNFKKLPQNFMKAFDIDDVTLTPQIMTSYKKIDLKN